MPLTPRPSHAYKGRFAPSPTGPLHFGSLVAAVGSFLDARSHGGQWLLRMEDLDPPREMPGAAAGILRTLEIFGLQWDGPVLYQSTRKDAYQAAVDWLQAHKLAYPCGCSRREIADSALQGIEGSVYPGTCRHGLPAGKPARALRLRVPDKTLTYHDELQGRVALHLSRQIGDFIVQRADGLFAYQLAVVVDDALQGITHVVRGADLLLSTPRQLYAQQLLNLPTPLYMHLPVVVTPRGEKLSKQTHAEPVSTRFPGETLFQALQFLEQSPPSELRGATPGELLDWGIGHWQPKRLQGLLRREITQ